MSNSNPFYQSLQTIESEASRKAREMMAQGKLPEVPKGSSASMIHDSVEVIIGDSRRCPCHPGVKISSPDGMHDTLCGRCEYEMEVAMGREVTVDFPPFDTSPPKIHIDDDDLPF